MSLRSLIQAAGGSLKEWTVMSSVTDPFRIDTEANRRDARWLAERWAAIKAHTGKRRTHARGLHYMLVGRDGMKPSIKLSGETYSNTDDDWQKTQTTLNVARWLGDIGFDEITDNRNAEPDIFVKESVEVALSAWSGASRFEWEPTMPLVYVPNPLDDEPHVEQPYRLVVIGEKSSLRGVIEPICERFEAEMVLPTGELSTTLIHGISQRADDDGRPCRVFYLSDFDPTGAHMPIEASRKLQGFCAEHFPELDIEMHVVGLTAGQVQGLGLPSTPMKDSEKRADKWRERHGCEQTELDALSDRDLAHILVDALSPYFDDTLRRRTTLAYNAARQQMQEQVAEVEDRFKQSDDYAEGLRLIAMVKEAIEEARAFLVPRFDEMAASIEPVEPDLPEPEIDESLLREPLFTSLDTFEEATAKLLEAKL